MPVFWRGGRVPLKLSSKPFPIVVSMCASGASVSTQARIFFSVRERSFFSLLSTVEHVLTHFLIAAPSLFSFAPLILSFCSYNCCPSPNRQSALKGTFATVPDESSRAWEGSQAFLPSCTTPLQRSYTFTYSLNSVFQSRLAFFFFFTNCFSITCHSVR